MFVGGVFWLLGDGFCDKPRGEPPCCVAKSPLAQQEQPLTEVLPRGQSNQLKRRVLAAVCCRSAFCTLAALLRIRLGLCFCFVSGLSVVVVGNLALGLRTRQRRAAAASRQVRRQSPDQHHSCLFCVRRCRMRWAKLTAPAEAQGSGGWERTRRRA